jgi:hypothetical protein
MGMGGFHHDFDRGLATLERPVGIAGARGVGGVERAVSLEGMNSYGTEWAAGSSSHRTTPR